MTSSNSPSSMSSTSSSVEHSPIDSATSRHARRKWSSAIKVAQGLYRFKHNLAKVSIHFLCKQQGYDFVSKTRRKMFSCRMNSICPCSFSFTRHKSIMRGLSYGSHTITLPVMSNVNLLLIGPASCILQLFPPSLPSKAVFSIRSRPFLSALP